MSNKHHMRSAQGQPLRTLYAPNGDVLKCYESDKLGEDYPLIVFNQKGEDLTSDFDAYDFETILHLINN